MTPSAKNLLLGAGKVLFNRWESDGTPTAFRHLGNVDKFDINEEVTSVDKKQSMYAAKTTYLKVVTEIKSTADITLTEFTPENLAMAYLGEQGVITQVAKTVTDEVHKAFAGSILDLNCYFASDVSIKPSDSVAGTIAAAVDFGTNTSVGTVTTSGTYTGTDAVDYYVKITAATTTPGAIAGTKFQWKAGLAGTYSADIIATGSAQVLEKGISVALATTGANGEFVLGDAYKIVTRPSLTAYVAGTDYKIETSMIRSGMISIPETSAISAQGTDVLVSYTQPAGVYPKVAMASVGSVEGQIKFLGDPTKGPAYNADMWHVEIEPSGAASFIGDDIATFAVKVTILDDRENHPDDPLHRLVKLS